MYGAMMSNETLINSYKHSWQYEKGYRLLQKISKELSAFSPNTSTYVAREREEVTVFKSLLI